jgi:hypothetical protein
MISQSLWLDWKGADPADLFDRVNLEEPKGVFEELHNCDPSVEPTPSPAQDPWPSTPCEWRR